MGDVLVVDDDRAIQELVVDALAWEGIPVRTAADGRTALAVVAAARPAVILLDMNMPVMDGVQFCAALDATFGRQATAIVVMTAAGQAPRFKAACGADDLLGKPFDLDELYAVVTRHLPPG